MVKDKRITIGSHTFINFPKYGIKNVPAKVDTGADSSSIWASNIREKNGQLSFTLFAPNSKHYTGEEITTKDYQTIVVKNSFGQAELRYKVRLLADIQGRAVNIRFTLANRARNSFPVLIGRRTLHGRFIVDVSRAHSKKFNVLVLKPRRLKQNGKIESFFKELSQQGLNIKFTYATYSDLKFIFNGKKLSVRVGEQKKDVANFDLVYFLLVGDYKDVASATAQYLKSRGTPYIDRAVADYYQSLNKLHQYIILQSAGIRIPRTVYLDKKELINSYSYLCKFLGKPFILKDIYSHKGRNNYLIKTKSQFEQACNQNDHSLIAQKFIPNVGDYRFLIFGHQLKVIIKRVAAKGTHVNNISAAGSAQLVKANLVPALVKSRAIKAAEALDINVSGVDMVQDKDSGLWYCLEVNESPQLVSSSFVDEKQIALADYLNRKLHKL